MFDSILQKGHGRTLTAYILFGAICLVFVFFGFMPDQLGRAGGGIVAEVNSVPITLAQLRRVEERQVAWFSQLTGGNIGDMQRQMIRQRALQQLVSSEVAAQGAEKEGVWGSDSEVMDKILEESAFQVDGRFSREAYFKVLAANRLDAASFEDSIRKQVSTERLRGLFEKNLTPTQIEKNFSQQLEDKKAAAKFISFQKEGLEKAYKASPKSTQDFVASEAGAKKIEDYYQGHRVDFELPEKVRARHILIKAKRGDAVEEDRALKKITALAKGLTNDKFAEVATANSQDEASQAKGGDLGYFERGVMVPEFDKVAFSLPPGKISDVVRTDFGYHLILVEEKQDKRLRPLSEVKDEIAQRILQVEAVNAAIDDLGKMIDGNDQNGVQQWAKKWNVPWGETGSFNLGNTEVPNVGSDESIFLAVSHLSPKAPISPLLQVDGKMVVLMWVPDLSTGKAKSSAPALDRSGGAQKAVMDRSESLFEAWVDQEKGKFKVHLNDRLANNPS